MSNVLFIIGAIGFIAGVGATIYFITQNDQKKFIASIVGALAFGLVAFGGLAMAPDTEEGEVDVEETQELELEEDDEAVEEEEVVEEEE